MWTKWIVIFQHSSLIKVRCSYTSVSWNDIVFPTDVVQRGWLLFTWGVNDTFCIIELCSVDATEGTTGEDVHERLPKTLKQCKTFVEQVNQYDYRWIAEFNRWKIWSTWKATSYCTTNVAFSIYYSPEGNVQICLVCIRWQAHGTCEFYLSKRFQPQTVYIPTIGEWHWRNGVNP
jgi:hypothetical protein